MKKSYDNLSMLKIRDITLTTKVCRVKAMVFPVVMYGCESWTIKRLSIEELMLLNCGAGEYFGESLGLQGDQTSQPYRKSTLSIHWKDWCWSWSSSTLATDAKSWLTGKDPDAGKDWGQEKKEVTEIKMDGWHHQLNGHEFEQTPRDSKGQGTWHAAIHGVAKSQTWLCDQTTTKILAFIFQFHHAYKQSQ